MLDIGAGAGNGARGISESSTAKGLDIQVTSLTNNAKLRDNFPKEKIHVTPSETLRGIAPESVAGVLAVWSIAYSANPKESINKINEVLVPGGAIKAVFPSSGLEVSQKGLSVKGPEVFKTQLETLGYNVVDFNHQFTTPELINHPRGVTFSGNRIILGIKPGNPNAPSAKDLLQADLEELNKKAIGEMHGYKVFDFTDPRLT